MKVWWNKYFKRRGVCDGQVLYKPFAGLPSIHLLLLLLHHHHQQHHLVQSLAPSTKMSGGGLDKCNKIRHIVRLRQLLRRWRNKARSAVRIAAAARGHVPSDVPAGHVAVCVGASSRRFVVRATHLNHPAFSKLLHEAEEEYGFPSQAGPLSIPCDESVFVDVLRFISRTDGGSGRFANLDYFKRCAADRIPESRPLLHGLAGKSVW